MTVLPVAIVEVALLGHVSWILYGVCFRGFILSVNQSLCLVGYTVSILTAVAAEGMTLTRDYPSLSFSPPMPAPSASSTLSTQSALSSLYSVTSLYSLHMTPTAVLNVPMILFVVSGVVFICSALAVVHQELDRIALSRGFTDPIPLSRCPKCKLILTNPN